MRAIIREAVASAWSQPVASAITIVMLAGMVATVLLTTGRTAGAEQAVVSTIDSAGTRSIVVRAEPSAGLRADVLERLALIDGIEWAGAFGPAFDAVNAANPDGTRVPMRFAYGVSLDVLGVPPENPFPGVGAYGSTQALHEFGMPDGAGGARAIAGGDYPVLGRATVPDFLRFLEPLVVVPQSDDNAPVSVLVVVAARPDLVEPVANAVFSVLAVDDATKITVETSATIAELRSLIEGQLVSFSRGLVIVILGLTAVLVAAILYGLVMQRRKDFGRRRALGASRGLIMSLLLIQTGILSLVGATLGALASALSLIASGDPLPGLDFFASVVVLAIATGLLAALVPAIAASRRDPLRELRVP